MKFSQESVDLAILAYPLFSNIELSQYIGCSITWLEKLALKHCLRKADYCFIPGQSGYPLDITGYRFHSIIVEYKTSHKEKNNIIWKCRCKCGKTFRCRSSILRKGLKKDCGYCNKSIREPRIKKEGMGAWTWSRIKSHANERGIPVLVDCDYVINLFYSQKGKCALSGLPIEFPKIRRGNKEGTASLDRIDSQFPYQKGNLQWLHKRVNEMKNKYSQEDLLWWCATITDFQRGC